MKEPKRYTFDEFHEKLIELAINDKLPLDMNQLTEDMLFGEEEDTRPLIGYQVVYNRDGSSAIHPDMGASFCLYNREQALKMKAGDRDYDIVPFYEGDIEEPNLMFKGDPDFLAYEVGQKVECNGEMDEIVGFITPKDKENFDLGYRVILKNNGTQSYASIF